jgi:hypothetical protein
MNKRQVCEEIFKMKNRIQRLEDRAMMQQVGPTELNEETLSTPTTSQGHQRVFLQQPANSNNIKLPSLQPSPSQQTVWEIWNKSKHERLHPTSASVPDDSEHDPYAHEDTHEDERWDQMHKDYNDSHDNEGNGEIDTPEMSDDDDLASTLDLLPAKPKMGGTVDDDNEAANIMTKIEMTGDHIVLHEEATTVNTNKMDIFVKKEMLDHDINLHDGKTETIQKARSDEMHMDEGTKYVNTSNRHDAYEATCKMDVDKTKIRNIGSMSTRLHTREDHIARDVPPADNKVLTKYEYGGKPNVKTVPDMLPQEELSTYNKTVDKHEYEKEPEVHYSTTTPDDQEELPADNKRPNEYSHNKNVMTNLTETLNAEKMLAYMNENYQNTSQMGDEDEPTADLEGENLYIAKCVPHVCPTISHRKLSTASPASAVQQLLTHLETTVKITPW